MKLKRSRNLILSSAIIAALTLSCEPAPKDETYTEKKERILQELAEAHEKIDKSISELMEEGSKKSTSSESDFDMEETLRKLETQKRKLERSTDRIQKSTEKTLDLLSEEVQDIFPDLDKELNDYTRNVKRWLEKQKD